MMLKRLILPVQYIQLFQSGKPPIVGQSPSTTRPFGFTCCAIAQDSDGLGGRLPDQSVRPENVSVAV
ncbi:hypothetical protein DTO96_102304 [Ephemeroptericola cinctiostellae]|uniref:Uncharacterized protein n=1 Tax=Ephemeroptericola cinctiostellae TaxID=2268024 RepID=A0A345DDW1_9BURK|nr:hypothetical protein DTO96_102304 [Ephemeroptericola cinctiostellae]